MMEPKTEFLSRYSGAVFFNIWTVLFSAVAATGLIARDRRNALEQVKNAVITPGVYCLAQFLASLPFNFIAALTFQSIFHWLTNLNPNGEVFIYAVLVTCGHLLLMEVCLIRVRVRVKVAFIRVRVRVRVRIRAVLVTCEHFLLMEVRLFFDFIFITIPLSL
jgi:hypothetical protein